MTGANITSSDLKASLEHLAEQASDVGVGLEMEVMDDGESRFVWISDFHRNSDAPPGMGRHWLDRVVALAHGEGLPVKLCCTSWNSGLVAYYQHAGFSPLYEEGEEVYLIAKAARARPA